MIDILTIVWIHFIADFLLQTNKMATRKSTHNGYLILHCFVYSIPLLWFGWIYAVVNGVAHLIVDWFTSKATTKLHQKGERRWFFVVIGLDQAIHMTTLIFTYYIMVY